MTASPNIQCQPFGVLKSGEQALLYTLTNRNGMRVAITNFGGTVTSILVPDKNQQLGDVVLGFDTPEPYENGFGYIGALIGRFGNRIAHGRFKIDGREYEVTINDGDNHLHGGLLGFHKVLWQAQAAEMGDDLTLTLNYLSADGEEGYPGNLKVTVVYRLTQNNELYTEFAATTDAPTPINLTQHSYFNLDACGTILDHQLKINADRFTPVGEGSIPLGSQLPVANTEFDFLEFKTIGRDIAAANPQLIRARGFDHNFVLRKQANEFAVAAVVRAPLSRRQLTVKTTEPALQFYAGNFLDGSLSGKGQIYTRHSGFCLEPQHHPDAPNQPHFPNTILRPGEVYQSKMCFAFSVY